MKCALAISLLVCLGADDGGVAKFTEGATHLRAGRWAQARRALETAARALDDHPDVHALLGIARYHLEDYRGAVRSFRVALGKGTKYGSRALYYYAMALSRLGRRDSASSAFARLLEEYPDSAEARRVDPSDRLTRYAGPRRSATVVLMQSFSYDDNAVRSSALDSTGPTEADSVSFSLLSVSGKFGEQIEWRALGFVKDYAALDEQDLTSTSAQATWRPGGGVLGLTYTYRQQWLDNQDFGTRQIASVSYKGEPMGEWIASAVANYADKVHGSGYESLDGYVRGLNIGLAQKRDPDRLRQELSFWANAADNVCDTAYLGYGSWTAGAKIRLGLTRSSGLEAAVTYSRREYHDIDPSGVLREDARLRVKAHVDFPIGSSHKINGKIWGNVTDNRSTVSAYTYSQRIWGIEISIAF